MRRIKILHICRDEKFIDFYSDSLNSKNEISNKFVIVLDKQKKKPSFVKNTCPHRIVDDKYFSSKEMIFDLADADTVVIHFLTFSSLKLIKKIPKNVKLVWSGWGADYYNLIKKPSELLGDYTDKIRRRLNRSKSLIKNICRNINDYINRKRLRNNLSRIDFFSSPIPNDYDLLKMRLGKKFKAEYIQINYASLEKTFLQGESVRFDKKRILIGNSATYTNNHLEVFEILRNQKLEGCEIVVPLSYGDERYKVHIINVGEEIFGSDFKPITDFLSLDEYNRIIASCDFVVMNHMRQQAIGNIGCVLAGGARLYLNKNNPLYEFLLSLGLDVLEINDLSFFSVLEPIENRELVAKRNQDVLKKFWGDNAVNVNIDRFISKIMRT